MLYYADVYDELDHENQYTHYQRAIVKDSSLKFVQNERQSTVDT